MSETHASRIPSLVKKFLMAASGLVLVAFVLGHMLGNLQVFEGSPAPINRYSNFLHSLGELLWLVRIFLLVCVVVHIWMAVLLTLENRRARGPGPAVKATVQASYASRTMIWSGFIVLAFILFHLADYTLQIIHPIYGSLEWVDDNRSLHDVYAMIIVGFSYPAIALFYVIALGLLCLHLSHGVSSMFQSLGLRNEKWRSWMNRFAFAFGLFLFLGFASIPAAVQFSLHSSTPILPARQILAQLQQADAKWNPDRPTPVLVNYNFPSPNTAAAAVETPSSSDSVPAAKGS